MEEIKKQEIRTEIDLKEVFFFILYRWYLVVLAAVILAGGAWAYSKYVITPMYSSTTSIYVINQKEDNQQINYTDTMTALQFLADYKELIVARPVLENAIKAAGASMSVSALNSRIRVTNTEDTRVINITVSDPSPDMAKKLADSVRVSSAQFLEQTIEVDAVKTVSEGTTPSPNTPSSPNVMKWTIMGGLIGAVIVVLILVILFITDNTIKTSEDVSKYLGCSTLALIPLIHSDSNNGYGGYGYGYGYGYGDYGYGYGYGYGHKHKSKKKKEEPKKNEAAPMEMTSVDEKKN